MVSFSPSTCPIFEFPPQEEWSALCQRPSLETSTELQHRVEEIMQRVARGGDQALIECTQEIDGLTLSTQQESTKNIETLKQRVGQPEIDEALRHSIDTAIHTIHTFHKAQATTPTVVETAPGVHCRLETRPIQRVGLYIPGGSAPLFSSLIMLGVPATLAGCESIVVCSPPQPNGKVHPWIEAVAHRLGLSQVFPLGGAQAIAAMTFGTESVPKVDKIFGPGNRFVTEAKGQAQRHGVAIDMPAGASELMILADGEAHAAFVAADALSQAEHGPDSQILIVTDGVNKATQIREEVQEQLATLPRHDIALKALEHSKIVVLNTSDIAAFTNSYAPEHLIINMTGADDIAAQIQHAGSIFLGAWSPESAGDYASGTNHTLPTHGYARAYSGVTLSSFQKTVTIQHLTRQGVQSIGPAVVEMARAEGLDAHARAMEQRLNALEDSSDG
ncbi:MAG TPA: histidinol dehydrogenase [Bacteroidetes bacterium]|nr:MAG: histidinol dehydrogenase [Rhodothermaceae bacterium TMED105]HBD42760.1 histidinol dehydrogenase [Bacteroidota bacterium]|tara:strand:- start:1042 stop:2379 length:1338 start_codon:yes stop_codon:yes gene_type:complete